MSQTALQGLWNKHPFQVPSEKFISNYEDNSNISSKISSYWGKRKSLGTDELSCLAKYLISHLGWQVKTDSLSSYINIYEKWHNVPFGKKIWGKCYIQQWQPRLSGLLHAGVGVPLNTEGKLPINVEFMLWKYLYR